MKFAVLATTLALVSSAFSGPIEARKEKCLSKDTATKLVNRYIGILDHKGSDLGNASVTADKILDNNYIEISDSVLSLEGLPLGGVTFSGKAAYIAGVLGAPAIEGINTLKVMVADCTNVLWYWNITGVGSAKTQVKGFNLFTVTKAGMINETYLEFNSIAWGLDTGYQVIFPKSS